MSVHAVQIIKHAAAQGELNQLELARQMELEPATLCRLVVELETQRLITRRRDPDDNRRVLVSGTAAGEALMARAQPAVLAGIQSVVSRLNRQEQTELARLLEKLVPPNEPD